MGRPRAPETDPLQLRYSDFTWHDREIPALIICALSKDTVLQIAQMLLEHYETHGVKGSPEVKITCTSRNVASFIYSFPDIGTVVIEGVDRTIAERLEAALRKAPSFLILLAYGDPVRFVSPKTFCVVRSEILIDKKVISGRPDASVDLAGVLREIEGLADKPL